MEQSEWEQMAVVGRIARAHGKGGQVIVDPETDFPDVRFQPGSRLFIMQGGAIRAVRVVSVRFHRDRPIIGIEGVEAIDEAEALAGCELRVPIEELTPLAPGSFYHHDLIGCRVETVSGEVVGRVRGVEAGGGGSRLVIEASPAGRALQTSHPGGPGPSRDANPPEILVPFVESICTSIDPVGRRIVIDPPEGLLDLNAPKRIPGP